VVNLTGIIPGEEEAIMFKPAFDLLRQKFENDLGFVMRGGEMLLKNSANEHAVPLLTEIEETGIELSQLHYFGLLDGRACFLAELDRESIPDGFALKGMGELFGLLADEWILVAGCAAQLFRWNKSHQYCGQCGRTMENKADERAKQCSSCNRIYYPRLSPAVIVAVSREDKILLARSGRFPANFYSVLAGFVEPGETLEECIIREVYEEVGIAVKNIRYFGSQPWPFPDSLMLGFTAEYESGEIQIDGSEIADANWFSANDLPAIPPKISIARHLIDRHIDAYNPKNEP
jgi:NAD+ diphosphatase